MANRPPPISADALRRVGRPYGFMPGNPIPTAPTSANPPRLPTGTRTYREHNAPRGRPLQMFETPPPPEGESRPIRIRPTVANPPRRIRIRRPQPQADPVVAGGTVSLAQRSVRRVNQIRPRQPRQPGTQRNPNPTPRQRSIKIQKTSAPKRVVKAQPIPVAKTPKKIRIKKDSPVEKKKVAKPEKTVPKATERIRESRTAPQQGKKVVKQIEQTRPAGRGVKPTEITRPVVRGRIREAEGTASGLKSKKKSMRY